MRKLFPGMGRWSRDFPLFNQKALKIQAGMLVCQRLHQKAINV